MQVDIELLKNMPYVDVRGVRGDGRVIPVLAYFDPLKKAFKIPLIFDNQYHEQEPADLIIGFYYAPMPADGTRDVSLSIFNTTNKYYYYNAIGSPTSALMQDFVALCGVVELYFLLCEKYSGPEDSNAFFLIRNLLEYLLYIVRSSFDLMQKITKWVVSANRRVNLLPDSFKAMFTANGDFKSNKRADIPVNIVSFYQRSYAFFAGCRKLRNDISHHGCDLLPIFDFKGDFGLFIKHGTKDTVFSPFEKFGIWPVEERKPNDIGSVLSFIVFTINELIELSDILSESLLNSFPIPPVIKKEYNVYFRGGYTHHLLNLESLKRRPWLNT